MSEVFRTQAQVRFAHCDAAGWMFYPRAFELINGVVEDWFAAALNKPFNTLHRDEGIGVPAVHIEADFHTPARLGDILDFELAVERMGRSSVTLRIEAHCSGRRRFSVTLVVAFASLATAAAEPIPAGLRTAIERFARNESTRH